MADQEVSQLIVVTQATKARDATKRTLDRTGDFETRAKMSSEMAKAINDGLYYYERVSLFYQ
jgi:la-related protein 1